MLLAISLLFLKIIINIIQNTLLALHLLLVIYIRGIVVCENVVCKTGFYHPIITKRPNEYCIDIVKFL